MSRHLLATLLLATTAACATFASGPPPFDPVGSYAYSAEVNGQAVPGTLTIEEGEDGYTGGIFSDAFPPIPINSVEIQDQTMTIAAMGPNGPLLIKCTITDAGLQGTWTMAEQSGTFAATKSS